METHIQNLLNKLSIASTSIATITLILLLLQIPQTCIPPNISTTKPHLKFPSSTCDSPLLHHHRHLPLSKKNSRLWSSNSWQKQLLSYTHFFTHLKLLHNHSRVLCVSAGAGHEVMALKNMGLEDVTGVDLVDSLPLVRKADPHNLPFFDGVFDFIFTGHLSEALYPIRFVAEMERTVRSGGVCVVVVAECGDQQVLEIVGLFRNSSFVGAMNVTLIGMPMTRIIMRTR
ncbi:Methyltransf_11 domain-containing protein [Cephalotus follicularis]|uniref:Methyltransf_11 domain-containing protein n=1 Tax=Cephalotus follicularis TaxID=3775 RepID=A0A1Q3BT59_CEPFO|nr:Methyltransf_11 domain-containing protein [Cephalotus follicularis]